jgi:NADPH:quinone reductase-like Zn-dependent oxidoreductase
MKAVRFHQHGGPEVLHYEDAPDPIVPPGGVVVRVRACALNHLDLWQRRGLDRVTIPFPHISGADVAGEIADAGQTGLPVGQRVMLQPGLSCGRCAKCLAGEDNYCRQYDVLGYQSNGGYAEYVAVPASSIIPLPDRIDFVQAAAFPLSFLTAWHMLHARARMTSPMSCWSWQRAVVSVRPPSRLPRRLTRGSLRPPAPTPSFNWPASSARTRLLTITVMIS